MNDNTKIILADQVQLPKFSIAPVVLQFRDDALAGASLIGKVENRAQNEAAVEAHKGLKGIAASFERQRKQLKEPLLEAGRQLDRLVATELAEVEKEMGRIANLTSQFQLAEQRRVREEEELQRRELARIEAAKQAELRRIAEEQAERERAARAAQDEIDRKAREAQEAAARLAAEATNKKQREAAECARLEAEEKAKAAEGERARQEAITAAQREQVIQQTQNVQEAAHAATMAEAKPINATRAKGQLVKTDWDITVTDPYSLAKYHPQCVTIIPKLTEIKYLLNSGMTVNGIKAEKRLSTNTRPSAFVVDALTM